MKHAAVLVALLSSSTAKPLASSVSSARPSLISRRAATSFVPEAWPSIAPAPADKLASRRQHEGLEFYSRLSTRHPLAVAASQSALLKGVGDRISHEVQHLHGLSILENPCHTPAMMLVGFVVSGIGGSSWLQHLEEKLGSGATVVDVVRKSAADFMCWAPFANAAYLFIVPMLTGASPEMAAANAQHEFLPAMGMEFSLFVPFNLLSFSLIPLYARQACGQVVSLLFTIFIASRC